MRVLFKERRSRGVVVVRLLASHQVEPGSIPGGVAPGVSHVGIVLVDVAGRRVFSEISSFPRPCIPAPLTLLTSPSSALKTSSLRASHISSLTQKTSVSQRFPALPQERAVALQRVCVCVCVCVCVGGSGRLASPHLFVSLPLAPFSCFSTHISPGNFRSSACLERRDIQQLPISASTFSLAIGFLWTIKGARFPEKAKHYWLLRPGFTMHWLERARLAGACADVRKEHVLQRRSVECFQDITQISYLPLRRNWFDSRRGSSRILACGNRAGRCHWSADFLGDLPFPPPLHSGAAPYSPCSTLIGSKTSMLRAVQVSSLTHFCWLKPLRIRHEIKNIRRLSIPGCCYLLLTIHTSLSWQVPGYSFTRCRLVERFSRFAAGCCYLLLTIHTSLSWQVPGYSFTRCRLVERFSRFAAGCCYLLLTIHTSLSWQVPGYSFTRCRLVERFSRFAAGCCYLLLTIHTSLSWQVPGYSFTRCRLVERFSRFAAGCCYLLLTIHTSLSWQVPGYSFTRCRLVERFSRFAAGCCYLLLTIHTSLSWQVPGYSFTRCRLVERFSRFAAGCCYLLLTIHTSLSWQVPGYSFTRCRLVERFSRFAAGCCYLLLTIHTSLSWQVPGYSFTRCRLVERFSRFAAGCCYLLLTIHTSLSWQVPGYSFTRCRLVERFSRCSDRYHSNYSPPILASCIRFPALSLPGFPLWKSCLTMPMAGGFSRGYPVSPAFHSGAAQYSPSFTLIGSQDLDVTSRPVPFTRSNLLAEEAKKIPRFPTRVHVEYVPTRYVRNGRGPMSSPAGDTGNNIGEGVSEPASVLSDMVRHLDGTRLTQLVYRLPTDRIDAHAIGNADATQVMTTSLLTRGVAMWQPGLDFIVKNYTGDCLNFVPPIRATTTRTTVALTRKALNLRK
ncbi:hypothetical protein PR048_024669 [Dryococelus australis]|uniref:Uncharacterized protein n=1 Tax=Dryococelus australis TaxID=614101 RepID=A0ABQ9GPB1_9NEOP|nr:hypothetical protein PR048_024669 [Dryococelus australis]